MSAIAISIEPKPRDLGGFTVRRVLPQIARRSVGPFVFFDHMGPVEFAGGNGIDVRPHPHIGLATVTYLFEGEIVHRDSLGSLQPIRPGDVNWMTAGSGIVHSERTAPELRRGGARLHGIQSWVGLPLADEETAPAFHHHPAASLPSWREDGTSLRLIAGSAFGHASPVQVFSDLFYVDADLDAGASLALPDDHEERALYVATGRLRIEDREWDEGSMVVFAPGSRPEIAASGNARVMLLGGAPLEAQRHMWWNFVSSSKERIEQAKRDWREGRFAKVPGETEFIPLPDR